MKKQKTSSPKDAAPVQLLKVHVAMALAQIGVEWRMKQARERSLVQQPLISNVEQVK